MHTAVLEGILNMEKMNLTCKPILNSIMAYWEGVEESVRYIIKLFINDKDISTKINERTEKYCSFTGLAAIDNTTISITSSIYRAAQSTIFGRRGYYDSPQHSGFDYYVKVCAENRNGEIIAESEKVKCSVKEF